MAKTVGLIGQKLGMTRIFMDDGSVVPVTVIQAGPCPIVQKKTEKTDGYTGIQTGYGPVAAHRLNKPEQGHQGKTDRGFFKHLREFRVDNIDDFEAGNDLTVDLFKPGERVKVTGTSKGKGFQGVMRRWNFSGLPASHGVEKRHRSPGAIGQCAWPSKVFKGKKMAGQMGNKKVTYTNVEVIEVRPEDNVIFIRGQVPGPRKGLVVIRKKQ
ncbi:MAG: 50S ribosomal protein L3 [Desulfovibrionales bacterium]